MAVSLPVPPRPAGSPVPSARGELGDHVLAVLRGERAPDDPHPVIEPVALGDEDHAAALYTLYELSYRGLDGVDPSLEWDLGVLRLRRELEDAFLATLLDEVSPPAHDGDVPGALRELVNGGGGRSVATWCEEQGDHQHLREQAVLRAPYQQKEADPHSFALPRLDGAAKSALVRIQFDEYGEGVLRDSHNELFTLSLQRMGVDTTYGVHVDRVPGVGLATTNLVSLFGLHRRWLGALVGHLALFEMASVPVMSSLSAALRRLGYDEWTTLFYDVHVVADAEHQTIAADELAGGLAAADPALSDDIMFGAAALGTLEARLTDHTLDSWEAGDSALLGELHVDPAPGIHEPRGAGDDPRDDLEPTGPAHH